MSNEFTMIPSYLIKPAGHLPFRPRIRQGLVLILTGCLLALGTASCKQRRSSPTAKQGILDLSSWDACEDGIVKLKGEWAFFWKQMLIPADFKNGNNPARTGFIRLPSVWNGYEVNHQPLTGEGYATFRLTIKGLPPGYFGLKILDMGTAYNLWVNGRLAMRNGQVGIDRASMTPQYQPDVSFFKTQGEPVELLLQVSNFYHRKGGVWKAIEFGTQHQISRKREQQLAAQLLLFGSLLIMGLYHLGLFIIRRKDKSPLFFGLVSIVVAFRSIIMGERYLVWMFPHINWEFFQKIEYLSFYIAVPLFFKFIDSLFSEVSSRILRASYIIAAAFSALAIVTPIRIYSHTVIGYEIVILPFALYVIYAVARATLNHRDGAVWVLIGSVILLMTVINDVLATNELIPPVYLAPFGLFLFIFVQSFMLSVRFSKAFSAVEVMSGRLEEELHKNKILNLDLEQKVRDRTQKLNIALHEIRQSNDKTISSIEYAHRIQKSLMPSLEQVRQIIPDSFVIWLPRDIVGGDVYYVDQCTNGIIVSVIDCTGHGVPGAFMTMLASSSLRRITTDEECLDPSEILKRLNLIVKTSLQQDTNYASSDDGMDASVCFINTKDQTITFAGANLSLIHWQDNKLDTIKGDRHSIGYKKSDLGFEFTNHRIPYRPGSKFYLYTDGIVDQLGGEKRFPFGTRRFCDVLHHSANEPFTEQKRIILDTLEKYRGDHATQDDITVIGFGL